MTTDLIPQQQENPVVLNLERTMTVQEVKGQMMVLDALLKFAMVEGIHYGKVPGTDKPTLYQAGAEKIDVTFRMAPKYDVEDLSEPHNNLYRYRVKCALYQIRDGLFICSAVGEASSMEEKYMWERALNDAHFESMTGQNRIKFQHKKEHGRKVYVDDKPVIEEIKQVRTNAADLANTVLKIAVKRAHVSASRGAVGASDLLDVDLDEEAVANLVASHQPEGAKPLTKVKAKQASSKVKLFFGEFKDKQIDDPAVTVQGLRDYLGAKRAQLGKKGREQYDTKDRKDIAAIETEIARRETQQPKDQPAEQKEPGQAPKTAPGDQRPPMNDSAWADAVIVMKEEYQGQFSTQLKEFHAFSADEIPVADRWAFYAKVTGRTR